MENWINGQYLVIYFPNRGLVKTCLFFSFLFPFSFLEVFSLVRQTQTLLRDRRNAPPLAKHHAWWKKGGRLRRCPQENLKFENREGLLFVYFLLKQAFLVFDRVIDKN
jgi:hypothetical protein